MVYCADDPIQAKMLEEIGCVAVMPLASLIGSGMGILTPWNLRLIIDSAKVPIIVDAGVGTASDATIAMELGCDGVQMYAAITHAKDQVLMASAMKKGVKAGREAYLAGRMPRALYSADPSSPTGGRSAPDAATPSGARLAGGGDLLQSAGRWYFDGRGIDAPVWISAPTLSNPLPHYYIYSLPDALSEFLSQLWLAANRFAGYALLNCLDDPAMLAVAFC